MSDYAHNGVEQSITITHAEWGGAAVQGRSGADGAVAYSRCDTAARVRAVSRDSEPALAKGEGMPAARQVTPPGGGRARSVDEQTRSGGEPERPAGDPARTSGPAPRGRRQRLDRILDLVMEREHVRVDELVRELPASPATVRRDLDALAAQQLVIRSHGGASAHPEATSLPMRYRSSRNAAAKEAIARAAVELVAPGGVVGLNGGTTTTAVAHELAAREDLRAAEGATTLVTNALNIAQELAVRRHLQLVVTGGIVRGGSFELVGGWAEQMLAQIRIDLLLLGVDAISARDGAGTRDESEALISARLAERSERVVVLADSTKLGRCAFARICELDRIHALITDDGADPAEVAALREAGLEVRIVPTEEGR